MTTERTPLLGGDEPSSANEPKPEGEAQPYGWSWRQLMHDSQGGWERKMEQHPPYAWVKAEDIEDLTPLYAHPAPTEVLREALERQLDNMAFVLNHVDLHAWHDRFEQQMTEDRQLLAALSNRGRDV